MSSCTVLPAELAKVPPFPALAARLLALLANPVPDIAKVAELIGGDPALTGHVLKVVNSYEFALKSHVTSIPHAVGLLGSDRIRTITTTTATATYIKRLMTKVPSRECVSMLFRGPIQFVRLDAKQS